MENGYTPDRELFNRILSYVEDKFLWGSIIILVVMTLFISADAAARYIFDAPFPGGFEITEEYLLPSMTFLALSAVFAMGGHVRVMMLADLLPKKLMQPINLIQDVLCLAFSLVLTYGAFLNTAKGFATDEYSMSILAYPLAPAYGIVFLGLALLTLRQIYYFVHPKAREAQSKLTHEEKI